jgi:hypothetical protein
MNDNQNEVYTDLERKKTSTVEVTDEDLAKAAEVLKAALKNNFSYNNVWQSSIAMCMANEFTKTVEEIGTELAVENIAGIFNRGAKKFLNLLINQQ